MQNTIIKKIGAGDFSSLAISIEGELYMWGRIIPTVRSSMIYPTKINMSDGTLFQDLAFGQPHALLLSNSGHVYMMGIMYYFESHGNANIIEVPTLVNNLKDVVVVKFLWPLEALVASYGNFHWFIFPQQQPACTEEWVHPCIPSEESSPKFCACKSCNISPLCANACDLTNVPPVTWKWCNESTIHC